MFSLREFVTKTITSMIGNEPEYKVREYALSWYQRGTMTDDDMAQIQHMIDEKYAAADIDIGDISDNSESIAAPETVENNTEE